MPGERQGFIYEHPYWSLLLSPVLIAFLLLVLLVEFAVYIWTGRELWSKEGTVGYRIFGGDDP